MYNVQKNLLIIKDKDDESPFHVIDLSKDLYMRFPSEDPSTGVITRRMWSLGYVPSSAGEMGMLSYGIIGQGVFDKDNGGPIILTNGAGIKNLKIIFQIYASGLTFDTSKLLPIHVPGFCFPVTTTKGGPTLTFGVGASYKDHVIKFLEDKGIKNKNKKAIARYVFGDEALAQRLRSEFLEEMTVF